MICSQCKIKFTQSHHAQKYCSKKCAEIINTEWRKKYRQSWITPEKRKKYRIKYKSNPQNKKKHDDYTKAWRENNPDYFKYRKKNGSDEDKAKTKKYFQSYLKDYYKTPEYKKRRRAWFKNRRKNPVFKLIVNMRSRKNIILKKKNLNKKSRSLDMLGCDLSHLKKYLENKFLPGMNWSNHNLKGWHVDHITPLASAKTVEDVERLMHYTNLQPLWAKENILKSDKMPSIKLIK